MTSRKTAAELENLYERACETTRAQCGIYATCSTCRYAVWPKDFEDNHYISFCFLKTKEKAS